MEQNKATESLTVRDMDDSSNKIQLVLVVIAVVLAVVAIIVACVGIGQKGTTNINLSSMDGSTSGYSGDKIWSVAIGHGNYNGAYLDEESGELRGFLVDITNAVCKAANRNCRIVYDVWTRCWDSEAGQVARGGVGLMGQWYDVCAGWVGTYDRYRTYAFSEPYGKSDQDSLYVKRGSTLKSNWQDMTGKKIGILDGWSTDEFCLKRNQGQFTAGVPFTEAQIVHYAGPPDLVAAINNDEVEYAFSSSTFYVAQQLDRVDGDPVLPCSVHGPAMMLRKVDQPFLDWWNPALVQLKRTNEYKVICKDLEEAHGHQPGLSSELYCFI